MNTLNGSTYAAFTITLSEAGQETINVEWYTEDGTAHAGKDYETASGLLSFQPGELSKQIQVLVYGREVGDTQARDFHIRVKPPVHAILGTDVTDCVITVLDGGGTPVTALIIPAGPKGIKGDTGLSAYEEAVLQGFQGTLAEWLESLKGEGRLIELQKSATAIQWRYVGDTRWTDIVLLSELQGPKGTDGANGKDGTNGKDGPKGADGPAIQMQATTTQIQWRVVGAASWINLIAVADLKGPKGDNGASLTNRGAWAAKTYNPGDYVFSAGSSGSNNSLWFLLDPAPYASTVMPKSDLSHWQELAAPAGVPGASVEMQKSATAIQWRQVGSATWTDLVLLSDLKGAKGDNGTNGKSVELQKTATFVQWRNVGDAAWINLIALADITGAKGADGKNIELQKTATFIQWRVVGDTAWTNLVALADLQGAKGADGTNGKDGTNGTNGADGSKWLNGTTVPASTLGVNGDNYLRTPVGEIYQKASGAWSLLMTISGGTSTGIQWFSGTSVPANTVGKDGDLHLHETTGLIRKRVSGAWTNLIQIPRVATSQEAKDATLGDIATSPSGVREFAAQFGLTDTFSVAATDLNLVVNGGLFTWGGTTTNTPIAGSFGRGIIIPSSTGNVTQIGFINGTGQSYIRFQTAASTWSAWSPLAANVTLTPLAATNINTLGLTSIGTWIQAAGASATVANGYPVGAAAGVLEIIPASQTNGIMQRYTNQGNGWSWIRSLSAAWNGTNGPWLPWVMSSTVQSVGSPNTALGTVDLNTLGYAYNGDGSAVYYQTSNSNCTPARNYPAVKAGTLMVLNGTYGAQQIYIEFDTANMWIRGLTTNWNGADGPWRAWVRVAGTPASNPVAIAGTDAVSQITPASLRAVLDNFSLGSASMPVTANLNTAIVNTGFQWGSTSTNTPVASSFGRGFTIASSATDLTQVAFVNGSSAPWSRYQTSGTWGAWVSPFATSQEGKDAQRTDVAATPVNVREFMEQYGWTATFMPNAANLNTVTGATDRTVPFNFDNTTLNTPFAGAYGKGIMFAGGGNFSKQLAYINGSADVYFREHNGTTWTAWAKNAFNENDLISTPFIPLTLVNGWEVVPPRRAVYRKILGQIQILISIRNGIRTDGTLIGTLPAGYRPPAEVVIPIFSNHRTPGISPGAIVSPNGNITIYYLADGSYCDINFTISLQ